MQNDNFKNKSEEANKKSSERELSEYLMSKMSKEQNNELNRILSDDNALKNLLSSEKAQKILKKLTGDKNG